jgi:hypothetical protein
MKLTKIERNKIYEAIAGSGADPNEFDLRERSTEVVITHSSGSTFRFRQEWFGGSYAFAAGGYQAYKVSAVVKDGRDLKQSIEETFDQLIAVISRWADEVGRTVEAPDLWAEMRQGGRLISDIQETASENTPFTEDEQRQIAAQLQVIKKQVREQFELTSEQIVQVDKRLDEAAEGSKHMGRKDWFIYFLGTITALIITATVVAGVGEHIFAEVIQGIAHLFTGGKEPPPIPPRIIT